MLQELTIAIVVDGTPPSRTAARTTLLSDTPSTFLDAFVLSCSC
jgi:hypothetical protein